MTSRLAHDAVRVRVPATSANVGPGFDSLALALSLHDVVTVHRRELGGVSVKVSGEGAGTLPSDEQNLVARSMYAVFEALGQRPPGFSIECYNEIPQERGLGSSAGAITAGILAARALIADGTTVMSDQDVLSLAAKLEGHPDNPAACLLGGFTITWTESGGQQAVKLKPAADVRCVVYVPDRRMNTSEARSLLPTSISHADAVDNARRTALLVHALTVEPQLLLTATEDRLHQPFRSVALPETAALLLSLREAGIAAVLSGAGPSVLAFGTGSWDPPLSPGWETLRLEVDLRGAVVEFI